MRMLMLVCLLSCLTAINAGSHSLMALATYTIGQTPFPEFSAIVMLDDIQIVYYDSVTWKAVYRTASDSKNYEEEQNDADFIFRSMYDSLKYRAFYLKKHLNHTDGVHVHQRLSGCELLNNDKPGLLQMWDAFDGQNVEGYTFDIEKHDIQIKMPWIITWDQKRWLDIKFEDENLYHPICIKTLRRYLKMEKNIVMRKVKPRVRLIKKTQIDPKGLHISCLATGFYPRHINLTLFRDGQPLDDDQITGGESLPNGDGTYQMRKSLVVSADEIHKGHNYNCTMQRLTLDNKLDIKFDVDESDPGSSNLSVNTIVLMCLPVIVAVPIIAIVIWMKTRAAGQGSGIKYSTTSSSVNDET